MVSGGDEVRLEGVAICGNMQVLIVYNQSLILSYC